MDDENSRQRWTRKDWWGVVIDAPDVAALAHFYSKLRGWKIHTLEENWATLDLGEGVGYIAFQHSEEYSRPSWPPVKGEQQMMLHLDFETSDLESSVARAIELGAQLASHQPQPNVRVLLDPAGHPFCFYTS